MTDKDYFSFTTAAGSITITADVPDPYNNLDAKLELYDSFGVLVASDSPTGSFDASITVTVGAGTYYAVVSSAGVSSSATSTNYGFNVGQYRLVGTVVTNSGETPAAPSGLSGSGTSTSAVQLSWTDNAGNEEGFRIERLVGSTWTQVGSVGANVTWWQETGLSSGTSYSYRVRAYNASGNSAYSNTASVSTQQAAPNAPSNLSALAASSSQINLSWSDNSSNESGFRIERLVNGIWTQVGTVGSNVTTWSETGLTASTTYSYRVCAYNSTGDSSNSNEASATTASPVTVPIAPSNLSANATSSSQISLSWTDASGNESGFRIERLSGGTWVYVTEVGGNVTSWSDSGLNANTTYSYRVYAYNSAGSSDYSNQASALTGSTLTTTIPKAPTNLQASVQSSPRSIVLTWQDNSSNESGFYMERVTNKGKWVRIATLGANVTTYTDYSVQSGNLYKYRVKAFNNMGTSKPSSETQASVTSGGLTVGGATSAGSVDTGWTSSSSKPAAKVLASWLKDTGRGHQQDGDADEDHHDEDEAELNSNVALAFWNHGRFDWQGL